MAAYLISYDLNSPDADYDKLYELIKAYGTYCHLMDSAWIVVSNKTVQQVYESLKPALDTGDHIFVVDISGRSRQGWLPKRRWEWIKRNGG